MKRILWKTLVCILVVMMVTNFIGASFQNRAYAGISSAFSSGGIIGVILWAIRLPFVALAKGANSLLTALAEAANDGNAIVDDENNEVEYISPFNIFFDDIEILSVNFFEFDTENETVNVFREAVAGWYYAMRTISSMVLLVILVYVGIRMAISTIASEKAMYKKMLVDWTCSLALLFLLHYIMLFTFACNDALVDAMKGMASSTNMTNLMKNLEDVATGDDFILGCCAIAVYFMTVGQTFAFLITYMKRMITVGFLIIIAPLITITYSIDKMGDNKAQALNTWLKEFVFNILIQPFHCILFLSFANVAYQLLTEQADYAGMGRAVLAILCIQFIRTGEDIVKKIFGFDKAGSLATMAAGTAMAMAAMTQGGKVAAKAGGVAAKGVNTVKNNEAVKKLTSQFSKQGREVAKIQKTANKLAKQKGNGAKATDSDIQAQATATVQQQNTAKAAKKSMSKARKLKERDNKAVEDKLNNQAWVDKQKAAGVSDADLKKVAQGEAVRERTKREGPFGVKRMAEKGKKFTEAHPVISALSAPLAVPASLAADAGKLVWKNKGNIAAASVGAATGLIGLAYGSAGGVAGYAMGSGLVKGYNSASSKTMKNEMDGNAQAYANLGGSTDGKQAVYDAQAMGQNDGFKDLSKQLNELKALLSKKGMGSEKANQFVSNLNTQLMTDPKNVTQQSIKEDLTEAFGGDESKAQDVLGDVSSYGRTLALSNIYKYSSTQQSAGTSLEDVAKSMGTKVAMGTVHIDDKTTTAPELIQEQEAVGHGEALNQQGVDEDAWNQLDGSYNRSGNTAEIENMLKEAERGNQDVLSQVQSKCDRLLAEIQTVNSDIKTNNELINAIKSDTAQNKNDIMSALQSAGQIGQNVSYTQVIATLEMGNKADEMGVKRQPVNNP